MVTSSISAFLYHVDSDKDVNRNETEDIPEPEEDMPDIPWRAMEPKWINGIFKAPETPKEVCERTFLSGLKSSMEVDEQVAICSKHVITICKTRFFGLLNDNYCLEMESTNQLKVFLSTHTQADLRSVL